MGMKIKIIINAGMKLSRTINFKHRNTNEYYRTLPIIIPNFCIFNGLEQVLTCSKLDALKWS